MLYFLDILYQTEQFPLGVHFNFCPQTKALKPLVDTDISEYRFDNGHPVAIYLFAFITIYTKYHPVGIVRLFIFIDGNTIQSGDLR